jgi:hypothetical protein
MDRCDEGEMDAQHAHLTGGDAARVDGWYTDFAEPPHALIAELQMPRGQRKTAENAALSR